MRKRLFLHSDFMGDEIRDAAAPDDPGVLVNRDGSVSAEGLICLLNKIVPTPAGVLYCGGSENYIRSGVKGPATCTCGQSFQPPDAQDGPWRPWKLPKHNQPD